MSSHPDSDSENEALYSVQVVKPQPTIYNQLKFNDKKCTHCLLWLIFMVLSMILFKLSGYAVFRAAPFDKVVATKSDSIRAIQPNNIPIYSDNNGEDNMISAAHPAWNGVVLKIKNGGTVCWWVTRGSYEGGYKCAWAHSSWTESELKDSKFGNPSSPMYVVHDASKQTINGNNDYFAAKINIEYGTKSCRCEPDKIRQKKFGVHNTLVYYHDYAECYVGTAWSCTIEIDASYWSLNNDDVEANLAPSPPPTHSCPSGWYWSDYYQQCRAGY